MKTDKNNNDISIAEYLLLICIAATISYFTWQMTGSGLGTFISTGGGTLLAIYLLDRYKGRISSHSISGRQ
jgi:hypothetical protein